MPTWKKVLVSGSNAELTQLNFGTTQQIGSTAALTFLSGSFSGSFTGTHTGPLTGTASWATNVLTASIATSANSASVTDTTTGTTYYVTFVNGTTGNRPILVDSNGLIFNATTNTLSTTASVATSSSYALTASYAANAGASATPFSLTFGIGLNPSGSSFNGGSAVTLAISGANTLANNTIPKWISGTNAFTGSNITDTGTIVQIGNGATGGVTIAAGGISVTGNSTFSNNLTVNGDLTVAGTASFTNSDNLLVKDRFILINSGSTSLTDAGFIVQYNSAGSGSAFYLEAGVNGSTGQFGRFAVAKDLVAGYTGSSTLQQPADEFFVTTKIDTNNPTNAVSSSWGGNTNSAGNMWVNTSNGEIYIWS